MSRAKATTTQPTLASTLPIGSKVRSKLKAQFVPRTTHGGQKSLRKRKTTRPFSPNAPVHLVLRSARARGTWSLLHRKNQAKVNAMIYVYASRFKIKVYRAANVGNHIHLLVKTAEKKQLADYLRVLAGRIAVTVSGAQKQVKRIGRFWDYLYWSRLVNWGRDFYHVRKYVSANELEAISQFHRKLILDSFLVDEWNAGPDHLLKPQPG